MSQSYDARGPAVAAPPAPVGQAGPAAALPITEIATLPALPPATVGGHEVSDRTGEPKRPVLLGLACGLLVTGAVLAAAGLVKVLWDSATIAGFPTAARMLTWVPDLNPVSFTAIVMVLLVALTGAAVSAGAGIVAYNAWNGISWARIGGLVAVGVSLLTILLNPLAMVAMAPIAVGAVLLWLPPVTRYVAAWRVIRQPRTAVPHFATDVTYGPLPRYV